MCLSGDRKRAELWMSFHRSRRLVWSDAQCPRQEVQPCPRASPGSITQAGCLSATMCVRFHQCTHRARQTHCHHAHTHRFKHGCRGKTYMAKDNSDAAGTRRYHFFHIFFITAMVVYFCWHAGGWRVSACGSRPGVFPCGVACSPCVCVDSLRVLLLPPTVHTRPCEGHWDA